MCPHGGPGKSEPENSMMATKCTVHNSVLVCDMHFGPAGPVDQIQSQFAESSAWSSSSILHFFPSIVSIEFSPVTEIGVSKGHIYANPVILGGLFPNKVTLQVTVL